MVEITPIILALLSTALTSHAAPEPPVCTDGGTLHCCQATFAGNLPLIQSLADIACYDVTPEDVNCIGTNAPIDPVTGCVGTYTCCQVNKFAPAVALFCSKPPGDCQGGKANCTNIFNGFGKCDA